uniref:Uncharacterized protein n=1 Tax=Bartonella schoenbuchensis (strain DSM 13525 / NCTC 13165 / R1) TaxID=687861 RepID=E6YYQ5_BARSR|nr:hypothetical protein B11C_20344 [Bartonella schoenbuchensis R1]
MYFNTLIFNRENKNSYDKYFILVTKQIPINFCIALNRVYRL